MSNFDSVLTVSDLKFTCICYCEHFVSAQDTRKKKDLFLHKTILREILNILAYDFTGEAYV